MSNNTDQGVPVRSTRDYSIFNFIESNREIDPKKVESLSEAIDEKNMLHLFPMVVDDGMNVFDGQHRLKCAEAMGLLIYYIVDTDLDIDDMAAINTSQSGWTTEDYLDSFAKRGFDEYVRFREFFHKWRHVANLNAVMQLSVTGDRGQYTANFKSGKMVFDCMPFANMIMERSIHMLSQLDEKGRYTNRKIPTALISTVSNLATNPDYDHTRMITKLNQYRSPKHLYTNTDDIFTHLNTIYNYSRRGQQLHVELRKQRGGENQHLKTSEAKQSLVLQTA